MKWPERGALTLERAEQLQAASKEGHIALGVLSADDWACMLHTVVEEA